MKRNLIEQAFDKLVYVKTDKQKWIDYTKTHPDCSITSNGITYKNGKILK